MINVHKIHLVGVYVETNHRFTINNTDSTAKIIYCLIISVTQLLESFQNFSFKVCS